MKTGRIEAFSDGVIAIIITIMVLEFKVPHHAGIEELRPLIPALISYVLSFIYIGIYWNNHHHLFCAVKSINGSVMWANLFLLFWLSLIPLVTEWMGNSHFAQWPVICYGFVLILNSIAYAILVKVLLRHHGKNSLLAQAFGNDLKGKISTLCYAAGIGASFFNTWLGLGMYAIIAGIWIIPDRRIEKVVLETEDEP